MVKSGSGEHSHLIIFVFTTSPVTAGSGVPGSLLEVFWKVSRFFLAYQAVISFRKRKYTDTQIQMLVIVFRGCLMITSCFLCDFVGPQIRRYADTQMVFPPSCH